MREDHQSLKNIAHMRDTYCVHFGTRCENTACWDCPDFKAAQLKEKEKAFGTNSQGYEQIGWETRLPPRVEGSSVIDSGRAFVEEPDLSEVEAFAVDDPIVHPTHYARWKMEPIEFIAINDLPWWLANVIKYTMRFDAKDGLTDLYKARSYLEMKIRQLEGEGRFWDKPVLEERKLNADVSQAAA